MKLGRCFFMGCLAVAAFCSTAIPVRAQEITLVATGSVWRYSNDGTDLGAVWRAPDFNDAAWPSGRAQLGYGDNDEATITRNPADMPRPVTAYFRRVFNLPADPPLDWLRLRVLRDDGAAVYLNGHEIARANLPAGPLSFDTLAISAAENTWDDVIATTSALRSGRNVLAVEVHQISPASADLSFDLELIGHPSARPKPVVHLEVAAPETTEPSPLSRIAPGRFRAVRTGDTNEALILFLEFAGTATHGQDYAEPGQFFTLPAGQTSLDIAIVPIDDAVSEPDETVVATLVDPPIDSIPNYTIDLTRNSGRVVIHDNGRSLVPVVSLRATRAETHEPGCDPLTCLAELPPPGVLLLSRAGGDLSQPLTVRMGYSGTAQNGVDYTGPGSVALPGFATIPAGTNAVEIFLLARFDRLDETDETAIIELLPDLSLGPIERYRVNPVQATARVLIHDSGLVTAHAEIITPSDGARFEAGARIRISYGAVDPAGYITGFEIRDVNSGDQLGAGTINYPIPPAPGTRHEGTFDWTPSRNGAYSIVVRVRSSSGITIASQPVRITVGSDPSPPIVSLRATLAEMSEPPCNPIVCDILIVPGVLRLSRSGGDLSQPLTVQMRYTGTAQNGVDYTGVNDAALPWFATIPAGASAVEIQLIPQYDQLTEGDETVLAEILPDPSLGPIERYRVDPTLARAVVVIHENPPTEAQIRITSPSEGQRFQPGDAIEIVAVAVDPNGSIDRVEFYDGERRIGESRISIVPGMPVTHRFLWTGAEAGPHTLTVRSVSSFSGLPLVVSPPVHITVGPGPAWPIVSVRTPRYPEKTGEPCPACFTVPGQVVFTRTGPFTEPLRVYLEADGTATPDVDYRRLPASVVIPAGTNAVRLDVAAIDDSLVEGPELVRVRIDHPPEIATLGYLFNVHASQAVVVIGEDESGGPEARLDIVEPRDGSQFGAGHPIQLLALGVYTRGEIDRSVEFFANGVLIGRTFPLPTGRPPIPCLPSGHTIIWTNPPPGRYAVTARSEISLNRFVEAPPVQITVLDPPPLPVVGFETLLVEATEPSTNGARVPSLEIKRTGMGGDLVLHFQVSGTATEGIDFIEIPREFVYVASASGAGINVFVLPDLIREVDETVVVKLVPPASGNAGYRIDPQRDTAVITIHDSPPLPVPVVGIQVTRPETSEPFICRVEPCPLRAEVPPASLLITRTGPLTRELEVFISLSGTARAGEDYLALPGTVVIPAGRDSIELQVVAQPDNSVEADESVVVTVERDRSFVLTPRYLVDADHASGRVVIHDGPPFGLPILRIEATQPIAEETSFPLRRLPLRGLFTITRLGPTNNATSVFVHYSGTATPGVDFPAQPFVATIPAGATSTTIEIVPTVDNIPEGLETLVATLNNCPPRTDPPMGIPCFAFTVADPAHASATVFIRDDGITQASVQITSPTNGATFPLGETISINAVAIDLHGYIPQVEFFDGAQKIGESAIFFIQPPPNGTPIFHTFQWRSADPGAHVLTARAARADGVAVVSPPVRITVGSNPALPVVSIGAADAFAVEPSGNGEVNTASFRIRRTGSTNTDLVVAYSLHGTATHGIDYEVLPGLVTIPRGRSSVLVTATPIDDLLREGVETLVMQLEPRSAGDPYILGMRRRAVALISDSPWVHPISGVRCVPLPDGSMHVCFRADGSSTFLVEASDDLRAWETLGEAVPSDGALHYIDEDARQLPRRFYRIVPQ